MLSISQFSLYENYILVGKRKGVEGFWGFISELLTLLNRRRKYVVIIMNLVSSSEKIFSFFIDEL